MLGTAEGHAIGAADDAAIDIGLDLALQGGHGIDPGQFAAQVERQNRP